MKAKRSQTGRDQYQAELDEVLERLYAFLRGDQTLRADNDDDWRRKRDSKSWRKLQSKFQSLLPGPKFARLFRVSQELTEVSEDLLFLCEGEASGIGLLECAMERIIDRLAAVATRGEG